MSLNRPIYKLRDLIDNINIDWDYLCLNSNAIHLLEKNLDKISWYWLSKILLYLNWIMKQ